MNTLRNDISAALDGLWLGSVPEREIIHRLRDAYYEVTGEVWTPPGPKLEVEVRTRLVKLCERFLPLRLHRCLTR